RADLTAPGDAGTLVVVQGADAETTLQRAEAAGARLDALVDRRVIGGFDSVARLLPSQATQRRRTASLPDAGALRAALAEATRGGPVTATRLEPFVAEVEHARRRLPDTPDSVRATPVVPLVGALLARQ